jgi:hypothetical protein
MSEIPITTYFTNLANDALTDNLGVTVYRTRVYPVTSLPAFFVYPILDSIAEQEPAEIGWLGTPNRVVFRDFTFGVTLFTHGAEECEAVIADAINLIVETFGVESRAYNLIIRDTKFSGSSDAENSIYEASTAFSVLYETNSNHQHFIVNP